MQLYLLAPVRLRDVVWPRTSPSLTLLLVEVVLAWCLCVDRHRAHPAGRPDRHRVLGHLLFFANLTLGTLRSIQAPRKVALAQTRQLRTPPASRTSGLLVLAVIVGSMLLQVPVTLLCHHFHNPWLAALYLRAAGRRCRSVPTRCCSRTPTT